MLKRLLGKLRSAPGAPAAMSPSRLRLDPSRPHVLNVGGGSKTIPIPAHYRGWGHVLLDIDAKPGVDLALDACCLELLEPARFDAVYCSHNLEHYYAHEVPDVLRGFAHVLKPDGFVEIRVPDIEAVARAMIERGMDIEDTLYTAPAGEIAIRDVIYGLGREIERSGLDYYAHKTGFSARSLRRALEQIGFAHVHPLEGVGGYEIRVVALRAPATDSHRRLLGIGN